MTGEVHDAQAASFGPKLRKVLQRTAGAAGVDSIFLLSDEGLEIWAGQRFVFKSPDLLSIIGIAKGLDSEVAEIEILSGQARLTMERHESRWIGAAILQNHPVGKSIRRMIRRVALAIRQDGGVRSSE